MLWEFSPSEHWKLSTRSQRCSRVSHSASQVHEWKNTSHRTRGTKHLKSELLFCSFRAPRTPENFAARNLPMLPTVLINASRLLSAMDFPLASSLMQCIKSLPGALQTRIFPLQLKQVVHLQINEKKSQPRSSWVAPAKPCKLKPSPVLSLRQLAICV